MFTLALSIMASLFLCIFVGFVAAKKDILDEQSIDRLNLLILNVTFPFMMVAIFNIELTPEVVKYTIPIFFYGVYYQVILTIIAFIFIKIFDFGISRSETFGFERSKVVAFAMIFTNTGFIGLPLIGAVLGQEGLLYASLLNIPFNIICFTFGVYLLQPKGEKTHFDIKSILFTPAMIGVWIGLFLLLSQAVVPFTFVVDDKVTRLPAFLTNTIDLVGGITSPLAMIIVGASLKNTQFVKVLSDVKLHIFSLVKLIIAPIIIYGIGSIFITNHEILLIVSIFAGLPPGTVTTLFAEKFGHDYIYASEIVFITTLYSIITIPLLFLIFE